MPDAKVALVIGAGDATGGAIARRFAREGFTACVTRRNADKLAPLVAQIESEGGKARAFGSDARKEEQMVALVETIEREIGPIEVAVFNIGANVRFPIRETTARVYFKVWEMGCFAGFLMGREAAKVMVPRGRGTILFTGATASVRGGDGFAAFAGAKHAPARAGAEHGARARAAGHPRRAHRHRRRDRHRVHPHNFPRALRAEGPRRHPRSRRHRRGLLAAAPPAAQRLDPRARPAPVDGDLVMPCLRMPTDSPPLDGEGPGVG